MTTIFGEEVTCAVCGSKQTVQEIGSTNTFGAMDLDTRPPEMQRSSPPVPLCVAANDALARIHAQAAIAAQQEARYAVLALSSAGGAAPFDAALRRYVEVLTADGALDVELELDNAVKLAPDEQIEVFRIVQEGLANARRHADARRAWVHIGWRAGRRVVTVRDDGVGFDGESGGAGQGLKSMRRRAEAIDGGFTLRSSAREGTAIEIVLRAA